MGNETEKSKDAKKTDKINAGEERDRNKYTIHAKEKEKGKKQNRTTKQETEKQGNKTWKGEIGNKTTRENQLLMLQKPRIPR